MTPEEEIEYLRAISDAAIVFVHHIQAEHHGQCRPYLLKKARKNLIEEVEAYEESMQ